MLFCKNKRSISRLLVVEDEPLIAFDNEYFLESEGYEVVATVDNAGAAIAALDSGDIDVVLLDVNIAGPSTGVDVARHARDLGVKVLFVTGNIPEDAADLAIAAISKPYQQRDLGAALAAIDALNAGRAPDKLPGAVQLFA